MTLSKSQITSAVISETFVFTGILSALIMLACAGSAIHFAVFDIKPVLAMRATGLSFLFGLLSFSAGLNASYYNAKAINYSHFQYWSVVETAKEKIFNLMLAMVIFVALPGTVFCAYYLLTSSFKTQLAVGMVTLFGFAAASIIALHKMTQEKRSQIG